MQKVADFPGGKSRRFSPPGKSRRFAKSGKSRRFSRPPSARGCRVSRVLSSRNFLHDSPLLAESARQTPDESRGGRARVAHVTCATVTHAHTHTLPETPRQGLRLCPPHTPHTSHPHTPHTSHPHAPPDTETQRHHSVTRATQKGHCAHKSVALRLMCYRGGALYFS